MQLLNPTPPPIKWNTSCIQRACFDCIPPLSSCSSQQSSFIQLYERAQAFCKVDPKWWNLTSNMNRGVGWYVSEKKSNRENNKKCFSFPLFVKCRRYSLAERLDYTSVWASPKPCLKQSGNHTCLSVKPEFSSINLWPAQGSECWQDLLPFQVRHNVCLWNFTDELKQLEVNNYCWSSVRASGAKEGSQGRDAPRASRGAEGPPRTRGAPPAQPAPRTPAGLHRLRTPATCKHPCTSSAFPMLFFFFLFFFFLSRIYRGRLTQRAHTHARSALTCICHSLHMDTFGHVTSIPQFASLFYFILPLVSSCQKKAEGGAVRKAFSL